MDITDEYIKMCQKAGKIQSYWDFEDGDYIYGWAYKCELKVDVWSGYDAWDYPCYPVDGVWLPRQDQLQDMLLDCFIDPLPRKIILCLWEWIAKTSPKYDDSMEKLWLSFVMHEKYNKIWNGSEWIKR